ncbi:MAG: hypothetical protein L3J86_04490 [Thermoplasmata archaeon]|nr:hypothetical protein [Thermoplasmata archaeon]
MAAVAAATIAVALLLTLPTSAAASPTAVFKFAPPYAGATPYDQSHHTRSGCGGTFVLGTPPAFNLTKGLAQWSMGTSVSACSNGTAGTAKEFVRSGLTDLNFTAATTGVYNVTAHWVTNGTFFYSLPPTGYSASYHLQPVLCLIDWAAATSHCGMAPANKLTVTSGNGTVTITYSVVQLLRNSPVTAGTAYGIEAYLYAFVTVSSSNGVISGTGYDSLNMAGSSGGYLTHVKVFA